MGITTLDQSQWTETETGCVSLDSESASFSSCLGSIDEELFASDCPSHHHHQHSSHYSHQPNHHYHSCHHQQLRNHHHVSSQSQSGGSHLEPSCHCSCHHARFDPPVKSASSAPRVLPQIRVTVAPDGNNNHGSSGSANGSQGKQRQRELVPAIKIQKVNLSFQEKINISSLTGASSASQPVFVLNGISMTVPRGAIYGLLGPSGCGKTSLLRCM